MRYDTDRDLLNIFTILPSDHFATLSTEEINVLCAQHVNTAAHVELMLWRL
jgi:hypothetical protein